MSENKHTILFGSACVVVDPQHDNVAVLKYDLEAGVSLQWPDGDVTTLQQSARKGQRIALRDIAAGEEVRQYASPFALSRGMSKGDIVTRGRIEDIDAGLDSVTTPAPPPLPFPQDHFAEMTFSGFPREDGRFGTRNYYLIVPTSMCASETAAQIAREANARFELEHNYPNVDGVVAIPTSEGCGCAANVQIDRFMSVLCRFMGHPNVGRALVIDLGCEQTNYGAMHAHLARPGMGRGAERSDWLTIQKEGGVQATIERALAIIGEHLAEVNAVERQPCPVSGLVLGTECGASDSFSGITANPLIGAVADRITSAGGSAILTEVPEMFGAEHLLMQRMRSETVIEKFRAMVGWYRDMAKRLDVDMSNNLVPQNIAGGLINPCIKSLGAVTKGGIGPIEGVLDYGEPISHAGLNIMQGPGNDLESVTGLTASGVNVICFSTGKGTITGSALVPVIKVASNSELYARMPNDMDFDAGQLLADEQPPERERLAEQLFSRVCAVASGERTRSELNGQRQFQVWTAGKLSL